MPNLNDLLNTNQNGQSYPQQHPVLTALSGLAQIVAQNGNPNTQFGSIAGNLGRQYLMQQQQQMIAQKRNEFMQNVHTAMSTATTPDEKVNALLDLKMKYGGQDFGLGIDDIVKQFQGMNKEWKPTTGALGKAPEGMEIVGYDQKGQPMIRKTKVDIAEKKFNLAQQEKAQQLEQKSQFVRDQANDTLNTIAEVEKGINNFGVFGNVPSIPGSERANWEANVNKLLAGKVIKVMTDMKEASKTGATGFGQLSEKELKVLQQASTALKRNLSPKNAQKYLDEIKRAINKGLQSTEQWSIKTKTIKLPSGKTLTLGQ